MAQNDSVKTFGLDDLTESFWGKLVFWHVEYSSPLTGPGFLIMVTNDRKRYLIGFEDLPFGERCLGEKLNHIFQWSKDRKKYAIEGNGWKRVREKHDIGEAFVRDDVYESFMEAYSSEEGAAVCQLDDIVGLALGTKKLEYFTYIRTVKFAERIQKLDEERERNKLLPDHLKWKPLFVNNIKSNGQCGEYAVLITKTDDNYRVGKFTILFQKQQSSPMHVEPDKEPECYILFEKPYYDVYGPACYPENGDEEDVFGCSYQMRAFLKWISFDEADMHDCGRFIRCFKTLEEAKEYALVFANANNHFYGYKKTVVDKIDPKEDHEKRIKRYEAYQMFRKHYKEIIDAVLDFDYLNMSDIGPYFVIEAIVKRVPEVSRDMLDYFWEDLPLTLSKLTQRMIEAEKKKSMKILSELK